MEVSGKTAGNEDNLSSLNKLCEPCEADNVNTQASGLCKECEEYMCNTCFRQHLKAKSCRNHTLIDTDAFSEACLRSNASAIKCKQHEADTIKYYCRTHEVVGCGDCIVSKHGGCKPEFIKDLSDNFQQSDNYKTFMNKLEKLISERNEFEKKIQMKRDENKLMFEKALGDIKQFRLDINKYLDKVEADITCQVKNAMEENETLLTKQKNYCTMLSTQLEEIKNMLNSELYKDNVLFIHTVECKQKLPESEKAISDMKPKSMKKYEFVCNKQMRSIVTSSQNLGNLAISPLAVFLQTNVQANENIINEDYDRENDERWYKRKGRKNVKCKKETIQMENDNTTRKTNNDVRPLDSNGARVRQYPEAVWIGICFALFVLLFVLSAIRVLGVESLDESTAREKGVNPLYSIESEERVYAEFETEEEYDDEIESETVEWSSSTSKRERDKGVKPLYSIESEERDYLEVEKIDEYDDELKSDTVAWSSSTSKRERDKGVKPLYSIESGERDYLKDEKIDEYDDDIVNETVAWSSSTSKRERDKGVKPLYSIESEERDYLKDEKIDEYDDELKSDPVLWSSSTSKMEKDKGEMPLYSIESEERDYLEDADMLGKGTVTDVREDGSVRVTWDNGRTGHYRVGVGFKDVTLI